MVRPITEPESQPGELHRSGSLTGAEGETRLMFVFFPGWETLLTLPPITSDSGVLPTRDRNKRRKKTKLNCNSRKGLGKKKSEALFKPFST